MAGKGTKRRRLDHSTSEAREDNNDHSIRDEHSPKPQSKDRTSSSPDGSRSFHDGGANSAINLARKVSLSLSEGVSSGPRLTSAQISGLERHHTYEHEVHAIPGADTSPALHSTESYAEPDCWTSTASYLTHPLPDSATMAILIDEYLESVHWFSLVILVPKFRVSLDSIRGGFASPTDKPFLLLLSTMLGLAAWYRAQRSTRSDDVPQHVWLEWSQKLIANSELELVYLMDQSSVVAIQALILLGSYYVYHGRPNLSFSLLGATTKAAQSIGLHQKSRQGSDADREERKRVWWTIYTWDR